uniref:uncharacterized protein n=1 Tax=Pristiophorus japonicus TaxID=55135 RepID=UPI00398EC244
MCARSDIGGSGPAGGERERWRKFPGAEDCWSQLAIHSANCAFDTILCLLHAAIQAVILTNGSTAYPIHMRIGVKQGCVIATTLFLIFLATMLHLTLHKLPAGVELIYRTNGKLFNFRRLQSRSKVVPSSVIELQYADDAYVCAHSEVKLQTIVNTFTEAYESMGLTLNIRKTKVLYQPAPATQHCPPINNILNEVLDNVDHFPYLGRLLLTRADVDDVPVQPSVT